MFINKLTKQSQHFNMSSNTAWLLWCSQILNIACLVLELSTWMLALLALFLCWQALLLSKKGALKHKYTVSTPTQISSLLLFLFALSGSIAIAVSASNLGVLASMQRWLK